MAKTVDAVIARIDRGETRRIAGLKARVTLLQKKFDMAQAGQRRGAAAVLGKRFADAKETLRRAEQARDHSGWL